MQSKIQKVVGTSGSTSRRDERSEKKHHVVDTEGAALCQNAVKRVFLNI